MHSEPTKVGKFIKNLKLNFVTNFCVNLMKIHAVIIYSQAIIFKGLLIPDALKTCLSLKLNSKSGLSAKIIKLHGKVWHVHAV